MDQVHHILHLAFSGNLLFCISTPTGIILHGGVSTYGSIINLQSCNIFNWFIW